MYEEQSCADRREFRRCSRYSLDADPGQCWGKTCGPWLVGVAAEPSCATPEGAPTATATLAPSGSVSCENEVVAGKNTFSCAFTLHNSPVAYQAVGWMDQPEAEYPFFSYYESEDGMLSRTLFPEDCGQTLSGRAIAFAITLEYLATVDFSHEAVCSLPTDTPVPPTDTPTPEPPTDTPIPPTDTPTPVPPTDTPTPEPSGSVSCANAVSANRVTCTFSLEHYALEFARVDWSDRGTGHAFIGNVETTDGIFSADIAPADCGKTIEGRAVALDSADVQLATVDFSHALVCPIPTDTPVPPTDTPTPVPPTDTPIPPTDTPTPVTPTDTPTPTLIPLAAPGNLRATGLSKVIWDAVTGATKYRVEWSPAINGRSSEDVSATEYFVGNMAFDVTYSVRVQALSSSADYEKASAWSNSVELLYPTPKDLPAPGNLRKTGKLEVSWDAVTGALNYRVSVSGGASKLDIVGGTSYMFAPEGSVGTFTIAVWALGDGEDYEWEGEQASLTVTVVKDTPVPTDTPVPPTDTPADTPVPPTKKPTKKPTSPPPPPATDPPCQPSEQCSPSSGTWWVYEERYRGNCRYDIFRRQLQQYTCKNSCTGETMRQYNKIVKDWEYVGNTCRNPSAADESLAEANAEPPPTDTPEPPTTTPVPSDTPPPPIDTPEPPPTAEATADG